MFYYYVYLSYINQTNNIMKILELSPEEIKFLLDAISEIHSSYNEDGIISLFDNDHKESMVQALAEKLEN